MIIDDVSHVLFQTVSPDVLAAAPRILYLNARFHPSLLDFKFSYIVQHFKPHADVLVGHGLSVSSLSLEDGLATEGPYDLVLIHIPKNAVEAQCLIARGCDALKDGGRLVCAAANKGGGTRLKTWLTSYGFDSISEQSKRRVRCVSGIKGAVDQNHVGAALQAGARQRVEETGFVSEPGVFGWNKIDRGSQILLQHVPATLQGRGADFGCGYGYLSDFIVKNCHDVQALFCIDADLRAVKCCAENLARAQHGVDVEYIWDDLTNPQHLPQHLDFIVMNPPFHEDKKTSVDLGATFIRNASVSLRQGGVLYMVANAHLPYEKMLGAHFSGAQTLYEGHGFKVFAAQK